MRIIPIETLSELKGIKKDDLLIIKWKCHSSTGKRFEEITVNKVHGTNSLGEVIVRKKDNLYFNPDRFLQGTSCAKEIYKVVEEESEVQG